MEKELLNSDKELLLKDLCARLPYGVKVGTTDNDGSLENVWDTLWFNTFTEDVKLTHSIEDADKIIDISETKPYLFPLSSMTEEQLNDFYATIRPVIEEALDAWKNDKTEYEGERPITLQDIKPDIVTVNWMLKNHFDYRGLIEKSLALDATNLGIYE